MTRRAVCLHGHFGPTLLAWLERHAPDIYRHILEADARSAIDRGHGNAIAQAYNHAILPLCNDRDLRTQIRWGVADFRHRFRRAPEGMWLPETARACARRAESGARRGERLLVGRRAAAIDE
jgi:alpha-amylase/alpha-mannosidase (GH57 family)